MSESQRTVHLGGNSILDKAKGCLGIDGVLITKGFLGVTNIDALESTVLAALDKEDISNSCKDFLTKGITPKATSSKSKGDKKVICDGRNCPIDFIPN